MVLVIDNYDSFTYNLVQYVGELKYETHVFRNDKITVNEIKNLNPTHIIISPGPCTPNEAGISVETIQYLHRNFPILGVCLGHQSIAQALGGVVIKAKSVMHGKTSKIFHNNTGVFSNITSPFIATRYHSLAIDADRLPAELKVNAWTEDDNGNFSEIMGICHEKYHLHGVQFHPESIESEFGHQLIQNFLRLKK